MPGQLRRVGTRVVRSGIIPGGPSRGASLRVLRKESQFAVNVVSFRYSSVCDQSAV